MSERILGLVGGTGPESTVDYYRTFIEVWQRRSPVDSYPRVIINSVEARRLFAALEVEAYDRIADQVVEALGQLASAGVGRAMLASNATHLAFEQIAPRSPLPLIHIADVTAAAAAARGLRRLALIGTRYVTQSSMYPDRLRAAGIATVIPTDAEQAWIHERYFNEFVRGVFLDATRDGLAKIVGAMRTRDRVDGVILGGTELALILTEPTCAGVPVLNTARIHVEGGVDWLLGG